MTKNRTQKTNKRVDLFLNSIVEDQKRLDCERLVKLMGKITQEKPKLWGTSIIGFGEYHYKYATGRQGEWFLTGFSPRKQALSLYLMCDLAHEKLNFEGLGKFKKGKGCLYIKRLTQIKLDVLEKLIVDSILLIKEKYN